MKRIWRNGGQYPFLSSVPQNLVLLGFKVCEKMPFYDRKNDGRLYHDRNSAADTMKYC